MVSLSTRTQNSISAQRLFMVVQLGLRTIKPCNPTISLTQQQAAGPSSTSPHSILKTLISEAMTLRSMLLVRLRLPYNPYKTAEIATDQALLDEPKASTRQWGHTDEHSFGEPQADVLLATQTVVAFLVLPANKASSTGTGARLSLRQSFSWLSLLALT